MPENLTNALLITFIGMGLVFAAIILLWGVMAVLVRLAADREKPADNQEAQGPAELEGKKRAAAAAVALALAQQADHMQPHEFPLPPTVLVTAWQAVMRTRILNKRGRTK